ncbi:hypothetical protein BD626DRAFT_492489, partial [Schizophyllum amplum]
MPSSPHAKNSDGSPSPQRFASTRGEPAAIEGATTPTFGLLRSSSSPFPIYSTPPSAVKSDLFIFSPSKVKTPTVVPLSFSPSPSPAMSNSAVNERPARPRSLAPSPEASRIAHASRKGSTMMTITEDEVLDDFLPALDAMIMETEDPGFSSDTCDALTTYLNLPESEDDGEVHAGRPRNPPLVNMDGQDSPLAAPVASAKRTFSVLGWCEDECARQEPSPRRYGAYPKHSNYEDGDRSLLPSRRSGNAIESAAASDASLSGHRKAISTTSASAWAQYTRRARNDPSWLAHRSRGSGSPGQRMLKRKAAHAQINLQKENKADLIAALEDVVSFVEQIQEVEIAPDSAERAGGPADVDSALVGQVVAPVPSIEPGFVFMAAAYSPAYNAPLLISPYFGGCTPADRALMHGTNSFSILPGVAYEAAHSIGSTPLQFAYAAYRRGGRSRLRSGRS